MPTRAHGMRSLVRWHGSDDDGGVFRVAGRTARARRCGLFFRLVAAPPGQEIPNFQLVLGFPFVGVCSLSCVFRKCRKLAQQQRKSHGVGVAPLHCDASRCCTCDAAPNHPPLARSPPAPRVNAVQSRCFTNKLAKHLLDDERGFAFSSGHWRSKDWVCQISGGLRWLATSACWGQTVRGRMLSV